jgi:transposase
MDEGHTLEELYKSFKIYPSTIEDWRKLLAETGSLKPKYSKTRKRKIDLAKLEATAKERPDAYLHELAELFNCTKSAIFYALKSCNLTYKKRSPTQKNQK